LGQKKQTVQNVYFSGWTSGYSGDAEALGQVEEDEVGLAPGIAIFRFFSNFFVQKF
jgi:hypothetical protein